MSEIITTTKRKVIATYLMVAVTTTVTGCATTGSITPEYVSPSTYKGYDCSQLNDEYKRIATYIKQTQAKKYSLKSTGMNIGLHGNRNGIYPTVNFGIGNSNAKKARDADLSRLYGESDAVVQSAHMNTCSFADGLELFGQDK